MGRMILSKILQQRPAEVLTLIFLVFLIVLTSFSFEVLPKATSLLGIYSGLVLAQIVLLRFRNSSGGTKGLFYDLIFQTVCVLLIFESLESVVHYINPQDIDAELSRLDFMIFGDHPTVFLERIMNPYLTDIFQISYSAYYFIPLSYGVVLLVNNQKEEFKKSLFMILLCFYLSYLGYILFPALGPRFYLDHLQSAELTGFLVTEPIQNLLNRLEGVKRDAFPSGHTAVTVTVLYLACSFRRRFFWISLPIVTALIFSTVYCRYHYVVDVFAGLALTLITIILGEWYYGWWSKISEKRL